MRGSQKPLDKPSGTRKAEAGGRRPLPKSQFPQIDTVARPGAPKRVREEILDAAAANLIERGIEEISVGSVAGAMGATKGLVYHYYRNKSDIIIDLHLESLRILIDRVEGIASDETLDPAERLYRLCFEHAAALMTSISYQKATGLGLKWLFVEITTEYQRAATELINRLRQSYENMFVRIIAEGTDAGIFRSDDPRLLAKSVLGTLNWTTLWYEQPADHQEDTTAPIADGLASYCVRAVLAYKHTIRAQPRG